MFTPRGPILSPSYRHNFLSHNTFSYEGRRLHPIHSMAHLSATIRLSHFLAVCCALLALLGLACNRQNPVVVDRVAPNDGSEPVEKQVTSVDSMVATEDLALAFMPRLHAASDSLLAGRLSPLRLMDTVEVADVSEPSVDDVLPIEGLRRRKWTITARQNVAAEQWTPLEPWRSTVERITFCKLTFVRGQVSQAHFSGDYELASQADLKDGMRASLQVVLRLNFQWDSSAQSPDRGDPENWLLQSWVVQEATEDRGKPLFRSVAAEALPDESTRGRALRSKSKEIAAQMALQGDVKSENRRFSLFPDLQNTYQTPGLAVVDVDQDGWEDIYLVGRFQRNLMLRNNHDGTFTDVAAARGLDIKGYSSAAVFADFDNDGDRDAFVGRTLERTQYLENDGGIFRDRSREVFSGDLPFLVSSIGAADYDGDGLLDVFFATYGPALRSQASLRTAIEKFGYPELIGKAMQARFATHHGFLDRLGPPNVLLRNTGAGFEVAAENNALDRLRNSYACAWSDFDGDGDQDLYVANDYAPDEFYRNNGAQADRRFSEVSETISNNQMNGYGMGVTWGDYDEDGAIDLYVSTMFSKAGRRITDQLDGLDRRIPYAAQGSLLFRQTESGFKQVAGLGPHDVHVAKVGWSYGGIFCDVNNDGRLDLYSASGYYTPPPEIDSRADT